MRMVEVASQDSLPRHIRYQRKRGFNMVRIVGTVNDSAGVGLTGYLRVRLDSPLSAGSKTLVLFAKVFTVIDGDLTSANIVLEPSGEVSYRLTFYTVSDSIETVWLDFHALLPAVSEVAITDITPTGVVRESVDTSLIRLADLLSTNAYYASKLNALNFVGTYRPDVLYYRGDVVELDGASYVYRLATPTIGKSVEDIQFWQLLASRGAAGVGTAGNDTAYGVSWDGAMDAPSRGSLRNFIQSSVALKSEVSGLAQLASPNFSGVPTAPTASLTDSTSQLANTQWVNNYALPKLNPVLAASPNVGSRTKSIATTEWVGNEISAAGGFGGGGTIDLSGYAQLASPAFTGTPTAPNKAVSDSSNALATTRFVTDKLATLSTSGVTVSRASGDTTINLGNSNLIMMGTEAVYRASWNYLTWNTISVTIPYALSIWDNLQVTWKTGNSDTTDYMKFHAYQTSESTFNIRAMSSNSYYGTTLEFYWQVIGRQ
jgi:hypothetical protein